VTAREQKIAARAELASLRADASLLANVTRELREMVVGGRTRGADRAMEGMSAPTLRLVALAALRALDQLGLDNDPVADLVALRQREYDGLLRYKDDQEPDARQRAREVGEHAEQAMQQRHDVHAARRRDREFLDRLERRRRGRDG
jgi:hypothetical protein